jgi:hypothetical protein
VKHLPNPHRQTPEQRIATLRNIWTYLNGLACEHHHDADLAIWKEITSANGPKSYHVLGGRRFIEAHNLNVKLHQERLRQFYRTKVAA